MGLPASPSGSGPAAREWRERRGLRGLLARYELLRHDDGTMGFAQRQQPLLLLREHLEERGGEAEAGAEFQIE